MLKFTGLYESFSELMARHKSIVYLELKLWCSEKHTLRVKAEKRREQRKIMRTIIFYVEKAYAFYSFFFERAELKAHLKNQH